MLYEDVVDNLKVLKIYVGKEVKSFKYLWGENYVITKCLGHIQSIIVGQNV